MTGLEAAARLDAALDLHRRGLHLLPLLSACADHPKAGKGPHFDVLREVHDIEADGAVAWTPLRDRRASAAEVAAWFDHDPACNVGVIVTPGLVVVDVDVPELFDVAHEPTPYVVTARGQHLYFAGTAESATFPWGEVKASGYVVVPPSVHKSDHRYCWGALDLDAPLARLPEALSATPLRSTSTSTSVGTRRDGAIDDVDDPARSPVAIEAAMSRMGRSVVLGAKGSRDFPCLFPSGHAHDDGATAGKPSASLYLSAKGAWRYHCHACGHDLSMARLFASVISRSVVPEHAMGRSSAVVWLARLWHESGVRRVPIIDAAIPSSGPIERSLAEGYVLLSSLRAALPRNGDAPNSYTPAFAALWCGGMELDDARSGLRKLRDRDGWLVKVGGSAPGVGYLYAPPSAGRAATVEQVNAPDRAAPLEPPGRALGVVEPAGEDAHDLAMVGAELIAADWLGVTSEGSAGGGGHGPTVDHADDRWGGECVVDWEAQAGR